MTETPRELLWRLANAASVDADLADDPDWADAYRTWMAYVPGEVRRIWSDLPIEARLMAVLLGTEALRIDQY